MSTTERTVAEWMLAELKRTGFLYQDVAVYEIQQRYGDDFVRDNERGNLAIAQDVLQEFRKLTKDDVIWDRSERAWRFRQSYDAPSRQQD